MCKPPERTHDQVTNMRPSRAVSTGVDLYIINYLFHDVHIDQMMFYMIVYGLICDGCQTLT